MSPEVLGTIWAAKTEGGLCRKSRGRVSVILECVTFINTNAETSQHDYLWSKTPLCSSHFLSASRHIQINPNATRNEWKSPHELSIGKNEILDCVSVFDWIILTVITGNTLKRIMLKLHFTSKRSRMISTYFSDDSKCSVKWHPDEALLPQNLAECFVTLLSTSLACETVVSKVMP